MLYLIFLLLFNFQIESDSTNISNRSDLDQVKTLILEGERTQAVEKLEILIEDGLADMNAFELLADLYQQTFSFSKLISLYDKYESTVSENPRILYPYAQAKYQSGFIGRAVEVLEKIRTLGSDDPRGTILLGSIYYNDQKWEAAESVYRELTNRVPDNLYLRTQLAKVNGNLQETELARNILREVLNEDPNYLPAIMELAVSYIGAYELYKAKELLVPALEVYPEQGKLWNLAARTSYNLQEFKNAVEYWEKVVDLGDADNNTFRGMGLSYYQLGDTEKALANFEVSLSMNPDDMISLLYSAMVYRQLENWIKAGEQLDQLFKLHITDYFIDTIMQRAVVSEELGKIDSAVSDYKLVKHLEPNLISAEFYLAALYDRNSDNKELILEHYLGYLENQRLDPSLEDYAKGRVRVLREQLHFARGRE